MSEGLAVVSVNGAISSTSSGNILNEGASASRINHLIKKAADDDRVKGLLLAINSPGGSAAASQEIYRELERFKEKGKPIVVSMGDYAASGGYYIASQADYIIASPATMTGSIGVIMQIMDLSELYDKLGINTEVIKAGALKDAGGGNRPLNDEERAYFQAMADEIYQQFIVDVARARDLSYSDVSQLAEGQVILASQALEVGLVDGLGNYYDALDKLMELTGLEGEVNILELEKKSFWQNAFGLTARNSFDLEDLLGQLFSLDSKMRQIKLFY